MNGVQVDCTTPSGHLSSERVVISRFRKNAIDKAKSMTSHIAYPDELLDDAKLNEFYDEASVKKKKNKEF